MSFSCHLVTEAWLENLWSHNSDGMLNNNYPLEVQLLFPLCFIDTYSFSQYTQLCIIISVNISSSTFKDPEEQKDPRKQLPILATVSEISNKNGNIVGLMNFGN
jgi:hypothetical protein